MLFFFLGLEGETWEDEDEDDEPLISYLEGSNRVVAGSGVDGEVSHDERPLSTAFDTAASPKQGGFLKRLSNLSHLSFRTARRIRRDSNEGSHQIRHRHRSLRLLSRMRKYRKSSKPSSPAFHTYEADEDLL